MKTANCGFLSLIKGRFLIFISSAERLVLRSSLFCFFPCSCVSSILLFFLKNGTDYLSLFCVNFVFLPQATSLHGRPPNRYGDWTKCVSGCMLGISTGCRDCVTSEVFGFYFIVKRDILPWAAYYFDHFRRYIAPAGGKKKPSSGWFLDYLLLAEQSVLLYITQHIRVWWLSPHLSLKYDC